MCVANIRLEGLGKIRNAICSRTAFLTIGNVQGIQQKSLSDNLFGAVPLNYRELKSSKEGSTIDYVDHPLDYYKEANKGRRSRKRRRQDDIEDNYIDRDSDDVSLNFMSVEWLPLTQLLVEWRGMGSLSSHS